MTKATGAGGTRPLSSIPWAGLAGLAGLALIVVFLATAWSAGKRSSIMEEACRNAYHASLVGDPAPWLRQASSEVEACKASMLETYQGPLDDPRRVGNAAAQHMLDVWDARDRP